MKTAERNQLTNMKAAHAGSFYVAAAPRRSGDIVYAQVEYTVNDTLPQDSYNIAWVASRNLREVEHCVKQEYLPCRMMQGGNSQ